MVQWYTCRKKILIQLPEGIKQEASKLSKLLESKTNAEIIISGEPCWGACDTPQDLKSLGVDLLIQWGHSPWKWKYWEDA